MDQAKYGPTKAHPKVNPKHSGNGKHLKSVNSKDTLNSKGQK